MYSRNFINSYIIDYFRQYGRQYVWRDNRSPFKVYLSEMLLQRTQADQVEPAFIELTEHYSNIIEITTNFEEVCKIMYSLGRFCRLNYFKQGLDTLVKNFNGEIPYHTEMLLLIPGIGPYIAAAIRIFGFGLKDTIIDTNVVRVLGRIYGIEITPETRRNKAFINLAKHHVPDNNFVEYSYGILDFASAICRSRIPECRSCGLGKYCNYYKNKLK